MRFPPKDGGGGGGGHHKNIITPTPKNIAGAKLFNGQFKCI